MKLAEDIAEVQAEMRDFVATCTRTPNCATRSTAPPT